MADGAGISYEALEKARAFITEHPRCSVIDLQRCLAFPPGEVWSLVHELENRRQIRVDNTPAGWQFTIRP